MRESASKTQQNRENGISEERYSCQFPSTGSIKEPIPCELGLAMCIIPRQSDRLRVLGIGRSVFLKKQYSQIYSIQR